MTLSTTDYVFVIYSTTSGTATARPVLRTYTGLYDPDGLEADDRPVNGVAGYDAATEGWYPATSFAEEDVPDRADPTTPLQDVSYTIDPATGIVTRTVANASLARRQREVLRHLWGRRGRAKAGLDLASLTDDTSVESARTLISRVDRVDVDYAATWGSNPESLLAHADFTEPTLTQTTTPLLKRLPAQFADGAILRAKLASRASYDFVQAVGLGPYNAVTTLTEVALADLGALPKGNIWAVSFAWEVRNLNNTTNKTTIKLQSRAAEPGGALSAWTDEMSYDGSGFGLFYQVREYTFVFGGNWDDVEFRLTYQTQIAGASGVVRNVYITAVRLTVWE